MTKLLELTDKDFKALGIKKKLQRAILNILETKEMQNIFKNFKKSQIYKKHKEIKWKC